MKDIILRLFRDNGLHGQIAIGDAVVDLDEGKVFLLSDLVDRIISDIRESRPVKVVDNAIPLNGKIVNLKWAEKEIVRHALSLEEKSLGEVADGLGLSRRGLHKKRVRYGFPVPERGEIGGNRPLAKKI